MQGQGREKGKSVFWALMPIIATKSREKIFDNPGVNCLILRIYWTGLFNPKESKMLTISNSDYLLLRALRIWISAKSGL